MKNSKTNRWIIILFILFLNIACEKGTEYEAFSGQLIGYVALYDSEGIKTLDNSGVEVIIEGSNPQIIVSTNEDGQFVVDDLKSGVYNIIFNMEGYCQHRINSFQFVGGNKPATTSQIYLYRPSNLQIDDLEIAQFECLSAACFEVRAKVSNQKENTTSYLRYYLSNGPEISYKNYISTNIVYSFYSIEDISLYLPIDTITYPIGSELYLIMYPAAELYQYYIDINTGRAIFTSINTNKPSEVVKITIPEIETSW